MTGAEIVSLAFKRLVSAEDFRDRFLEYLKQVVRDLGSRIWSGDGVFDSPLTLSGTAADTITIGARSASSEP